MNGKSAILHNDNGGGRGGRKKSKNFSIKVKMNICTEKTITHSPRTQFTLQTMWAFVKHSRIRHTNGKNQISAALVQIQYPLGYN